MPQTYHSVTQLRYPQVHPGIPILFTDPPLLLFTLVLRYLWTAWLVILSSISVLFIMRLSHTSSRFHFYVARRYEKPLETLRYKCVLHVCLSVCVTIPQLFWSCTISNNVPISGTRYIQCIVNEADQLIDTNEAATMYHIVVTLSWERAARNYVFPGDDRRRDDNFFQSKKFHVFCIAQKLGVHAQCQHHVRKWRTQAP